MPRGGWRTRRPHARIVGYAGLGLVLLNACSLFVDFGAYPGAAEAEAEDGGVDGTVTNDAVIDTAIEAAFDGGASDALSEADAPDIPCLNDLSHLCDDFGAPYDSRWTAPRITTGIGAIGIDDGGARSPPTSLLTRTTDASTASAAALYLTWAGPRTGVTCKFHVRADLLGPGRTQMFALDSRFPTGNLSAHIVYLGLKAASSDLSEQVVLRDGGNSTKAYDMGAFTAVKGTNFVEFTIDVAYSTTGAPSKIRVFVDGVERAFVDASPIPATFTGSTLQLGIVSGLGTARVRHEDVRCEQR
jgi:hypothetical protein